MKIASSSTVRSLVVKIDGAWIDLMIMRATDRVRNLTQDTFRSGKIIDCACIF